MKKILASFFAFALICGFAAYDKKTDNNEKKATRSTKTVSYSEKTETEPETEPDTVAIYIPIAQKITRVKGGETAVSYKYEENWQEKDTFTFTLVGSVLDKNQKTTITVSNRNTITETKVNGKKQITEEYYDNHGRVIKVIATVALSSYESEKTETVNTYDDQGRLASQKIAYYTDGQVSRTRTVPFTYQKISVGSMGTGNSGDRVFVYDENNQLVREVVKEDGQEVTRTEYTYKDGHQETVSFYYQGKLEYSIKTTLKAVAVSPEKAAMLPWAK